jgi:hypothetical protein
MSDLSAGHLNARYGDRTNFMSAACNICSTFSKIYAPGVPFERWLGTMTAGCWCEARDHVFLRRMQAGTNRRPIPSRWKPVSPRRAASSQGSSFTGHDVGVPGDSDWVDSACAWRAVPLPPRTIPNFSALGPAANAPRARDETNDRKLDPHKNCILS